MPKKVLPLSERNLTQSWFVTMIAALYFFYIFIQITIFNAIGHDLLLELRMDSTGLGVLSSFYFWGNVICLIPAGLLLDRFSAKKMLIVSMVVAVGSTFAPCLLKQRIDPEIQIPHAVLSRTAYSGPRQVVLYSLQYKGRHIQYVNQIADADLRIAKGYQRLHDTWHPGPDRS